MMPTPVTYTIEDIADLHLNELYYKIATVRNRMQRDHEYLKKLIRHARQVKLPEKLIDAAAKPYTKS